ncbi:MAG TPA: DUF935 family protein [Thermoguttaceae bacterium]|nr:DUF935 family protein [Thermoguttaceae bacterium]
MRRVTDMFGRLFKRRPDPRELRQRTLSAGVRDRQSLGSILTSVTPQRIVAIFNEADYGYPGRQIELAQDLRERDDHIFSVDQTRRGAVGAIEFIIEPGDDSPNAKRAAEAFEKDWEFLEPRTIYGRMMDAVLEQWHIERLLWDTDGVLDGRPHWRPVAAEAVDARRLVWPYMTTDDPGDITPLIPQIMRAWNPNDTEPIEPGKYLVHSYSAKRGRPGKGAMVRCVAAYWMFKKFALVDLATLLEQWGRPWPLIKYDPSATTEEIRDWLDRLADSMADRVMAVPLGSEAEVKQASASGADTPHINMVKLCNEGISKVLVGSTTIAEAAANAESVSSPTHASVRMDIRNADAWAIASSVRMNVAVPYTLWNFGPDVAPPKIRPNLAPKPDPEARGRVYSQAAVLGLRVKSEQLYSELSLDKPEGVEEVIELQPAGAGVENPFAGLFGGASRSAAGANRKPQAQSARAHRAPPGSVAPGGDSAADDPALIRWGDQAAEAAGRIGDEKFARLAAFLDGLERQGASLQDVQARLSEALDHVASADEAELNHQATMAALLRGRYAVAKEGGEAVAEGTER